MAAGRNFHVALMLVALATVSVVAQPASRKQEINAYDVKAAPEALHSEEGKEATGASPEKVDASNFSEAMSKAQIRAAEKKMKEAEVAKSPEEAAVAQKAASKNMAAAMVYALKGAAAVVPTAADAMEQKEADTKSATGAKENAGGDSPAEDVASKYSEAIISNAVSKAYVRAAEKNMKESEVAKSPEEAAVAQKAASKNMAAAMMYAFKGAAAVAPPAADATTKDVGYKA